MVCVTMEGYFAPESSPRQARVSLDEAMRCEHRTADAQRVQTIAAFEHQLFHLGVSKYIVSSFQQARQNSLYLARELAWVQVPGYGGIS